jgi:murein L,D-transpeptidase YafK
MSMQKLLLLILLVTMYSCLFAQNNRRANYFETFLEVNDSIDSMVVCKAKRELVAFHQGKKIKKYVISLGEEAIGKKQFEGDMRTPEGHYFINSRDTNSSYHTNLGISYPNIEDSTFAALQGLNAGGDIKIHGFPNRHIKVQEKQFLNTDWTMGCIAVSDFEIDELYKWVMANCPILILP